MGSAISHQSCDESSTEDTEVISSISKTCDTEAIFDDIESLSQRFVPSNGMYKYACEFSLEAEQKMLTDFLVSEEFDTLIKKGKNVYL
jgi:hypothetical protein